MAGRVDDVDVRAEVLDGAILGEDRDPALAFEIVGIHHPLDDVLVRSKRPRLDEQLVDQRRLAVVDVGDDRDIAQGPRSGHMGDAALQNLKHAILPLWVLLSQKTFAKSDI